MLKKFKPLLSHILLSACAFSVICRASICLTIFHDNVPPDDLEQWISINVNAMIDTLLRKMDVSENDLPYYHYGLVTVLETASVQLFCIFWTAFRNQLTDYLIFYIIFC